MTEVPPRLVEVGASFAQTYRPVLDFHGWKVAMLRHFDAVAPETFHRLERHWNTNEVFILTAGRADLIVCDGDAEPGDPAFVIPMEPHVAYNVGQSVWHHVVLSPDAHVVIIERSETSVETTDYAELPSARIAELTTRFGVGSTA